MSSYVYMGGWKNGTCPIMYGVLITGVTPGGMFDTTLLEFLASVVVTLVPADVDWARDSADELTLVVVGVLLTVVELLSYPLVVSFTSL